MKINVRVTLALNQRRAPSSHYKQRRRRCFSVTFTKGRVTKEMFIIIECMILTEVLESFSAGRTVQ